MNALAKQESGSAVMEGSTLLQVISRAAADPQTDVEKMERLMRMYERIESKRAEASFASDLAEMQDDLPSIGERGNAAGRYTYALWEDINAAIKPVLKRYGFALSFRTDFADGIAVTGVLTHKGGHKVETTIKLPADASGNKNAVQAVASSVSYGKRYTAGALLNLTSHGEDDDAYRAVEPTISDEQEIQLSEMLDATGSDKTKFLGFFEVGGLSELPAKRFNQAILMLRAKEKNRG